MNDLIDKVRWCYRMMHLTKWVCDRAGDDHVKRLVARFAFLYLDALSKLLPRIKNKLKPKGDVAAAEAKTKQFAVDYENAYATIRDKLAAHRQFVPLHELYEVWFTDLDATTIGVFLADVEDIYQQFQLLDPTLPALDTSPDEVDASLAGKLEAELKHVPKSIQVGGGSFDPMAPGVVALMPGLGQEYQQIGSRLVSILDFRRFVMKHLIPTTTPGSDSERLFKVAYLSETISLIDNMYPHAPANPAHQYKSYLEKAREHRTHKGLADLEDAYVKHDQALEGQLRAVRNKIAAHVDDQLPLVDLLAMLDGLGLDKIRTLGAPAYAAFAKSCPADPRTMMLTLGGSIPHALEIEEKDSKPFDG